MPCSARLATKGYKPLTLVGALIYQLRDTGNQPPNPGFVKLKPGFTSLATQGFNPLTFAVLMPCSTTRGNVSSASSPYAVGSGLGVQGSSRLELHCESMSTTKGSVLDHAFPYSDHEALTAELRLDRVAQDGVSQDGSNGMGPLARGSDRTAGTSSLSL